MHGSLNAARALRVLWMRRVCIAVLCCVAWLCAPPLRAQGTGYWHTSGAQILDSSNVAVRIAGVNWYGFETADAVAHGLDQQDYKVILQAVAANGYNTIRIPLSNQMIETPAVPTAVQFSNAGGAINGDLKGLNSLGVLDAIVTEAGKLGLRVILDDHRSEAGNGAEASGLWYTSAYPESAWIADWQTLATRYLGNTTVVGVDLRNEPHNANSGGACWSCGEAARDWHLAAQRAGNAVLRVNPHLLIFAEGTDAYGANSDFWGGELSGVKDAPVVLSTANQLVYSPHDYGPLESPQTWFNSSTTAASLTTNWNTHWGFIAAGGLAPVWLGEFGTDNVDADVDSIVAGSQGQWFSALVSYLQANGEVSWTYWALNSEDHYALLGSGYSATPANAAKQAKLAFLQFALAGAASSGNAPVLSYKGAATAVYGVTNSAVVQVAGVSGLGVPTGAVTLSVDGGPTTSVTISGAQATFPLGALSAGSHPLLFSYAGDSAYAAATLPATLVVTPAPLIATAAAATRTYGDPNPAFTGTLSGVVSGDGILATYTSGAGAGTAIGSYSSGANAVTPVLSDPGGKLANYTPTLNLGTLTITPLANAVTMAAVATQTYGAAALTLSASAASGGAVTFAVTSGPAVVSGATLTLTGAGTVTVTASVAAAGNFAAGSAVRSFVVSPAAAKIAVNSASRAVNTANSPFSGVVTGLVNGDTAASLAIAYSTTATVTSAAGTYPITATALNANYAITVVPGTLTVTSTAVISWTAPAGIVYGTPLSALQLNATSSVPLTFTYSPPAGTVLNAGSQMLNVSGISGANAVPVTAAVGILVQQAPTSILVSAPTTATNPFTVTAAVTSGNGGSVTGLVNFFDVGVLIGSSPTDAKGTATFAISPLAAGPHSFTATYPGDSNNLQSTSAAVTVSGTTSSSGFALAALPTTMSVVAGSSGSAVISVTPAAAMSGTVAFTCSGLPTGATCAFTPATLVFTNSLQPQTTSVSVSLPAVRASVADAGPVRVWMAMLPGFGCLLLLHRRRRLGASLLCGVLVVATVTVSLAGCSLQSKVAATGSSYVGAYSLVLTASSGTMQQTTTVLVNVTQ